MHGTYESELEKQRKIQRTLVRGDAQLCGCVLGDVVKAIWRNQKVAAKFADAIGCGTRSAEYQISGEHSPSEKIVAAIVWMIVHNTREPPRVK